MMRKFSEVLEEYLRLREDLNDETMFYSIPGRSQAREELAELASELDFIIESAGKPIFASAV